MRPIPAAALRQFDVFTSDQAICAGWTPSELRHAIRTERVVRVRNGVYALAPITTGDPFADRMAAVQRQAAAVALTNPRVPISHGSGALLHGVDLRSVPKRVCVTYPRGRRDSIPRTHRPRGRLFRGDVRALGCIRLLSVPRTVLYVGCEAGVDDAIVAADSALRQGLTDMPALMASLERSSGWPGVRNARRAIPFADPRAESALESISRLRIIEAGLALPEPQVIIRDQAGRFVARVDFYWDEFGVVGEADGIGKYAGLDEPLLREKRREGLLDDLGLFVGRWGWSDLPSFDAVIARLERDFARGIRADRPPRLWRAESTWPRTAVAS